MQTAIPDADAGAGGGNMMKADGKGNDNGAQGQQMTYCEMLAAPY
jgi:hypothetical protein